MKTVLVSIRLFSWINNLRLPGQPSFRLMIVSSDGPIAASALSLIPTEDDRIFMSSFLFPMNHSSFLLR
jgi:hypothetical protein